jgi:hypothetical protein
MPKAFGNIYVSQNCHMGMHPEMANLFKNYTVWGSIARATP